MAINNLIAACRRNDIAEAERMLSDSGQLDCRDENGFTPLHWACQEGYQELTRLLLERGASVTLMDEEHFLPLEIAIYEGHLGVVQVFYGLGLLQRASRANFSSLHCAASVGNNGIVSFLLEIPVDPNQRDDGGRTPLHWAAQEGHLRVAKALLSAGANSSVLCKNGFTPLATATGEGNASMVKLLLDHNANPNLGSNGQFPLHLACAYGHREIVALLLQYGANIENRDQDGRSAIFYAVKSEFLSVVKDLIEHGAQLNAVDKQGQNLLSISKGSGNKALFEMLVRHSNT